ncbi:hypothetical protein G6L91_11495 [Agrobacterium rhizogenes]|uniref:hypothetical protein n=1 Tax=Rhizobium rhizogenes TaxID=359 RepID=UPI0015749E81|nr:hypothetical protein [Rhizobium rhizogenes]NTF62091.1 hypothetical protein [Rhizobium rhizogenes]
MIVVPDEQAPTMPAAPQPSVTPPQLAPGNGETIGAAGSLFNWPYRLSRYAFEQNKLPPVDPGYNPFKEIQGTKYASDPMRFAFSRNESETRQMMADWDRDELDHDIYARSGWLGTVAMVGAGLADPTLFFPVAKVFSGVASGQKALSLAGDMALTGAASASVGEATMYATTPDYTVGDVAKGIGTSTLLAGFLGGAAGLLSAPERAALAGKLNQDRINWTKDLEASTSPQAVGAAAADTRQVELVKTPLDFIPGGDPTSGFSPTRRILSSPFTAARRALVDLAETPYLFKENLEGVPVTNGPALDREMKLAAGKAKVGLAETLQGNFYEYRLGAQDPNILQRAATGINDLRGQTGGLLTNSEFKDAIDDALRNGDTHAIPQVASSAQWIRSNILNPWRDRAIKAGLLPEGVDVATADSYMMRSWNKQKVIAQRPEIINRIADWYESEQTRKAALQDGIRSDQSLMDEYQGSISKVEAQLVARQDKLETLGAQRGEVSSLNRTTYQRAGASREQLENLLDQQVLHGTDNDASVAATRSKAKGGAFFETRIRDRQNVLANRISGTDAEVENLQRRLDDLHSKRDALRIRIEEKVGQWQGSSTGEAVGALKNRAAADAARHASIDAGTYAGKGERLTSADAAVDAAVRRILASERDLSRQELANRAERTVDRIVGTPDGRIPYDDGSTSAAVPGDNGRGPLASRELMIPDSSIRDFLNTDIEHTLNQYLNTIVPDVLLTERFGDVDMSDAFRRLAEEHTAMSSAATSEKARTKLADQYAKSVADLAAVRDRIRGLYGFSSDPRGRQWGRIAATIGKTNQMADLGGTAITSLADMAGPIFLHGLGSTFRYQWAPFAQMLADPAMRKLVGQARQEMKALGVAAETFLQMRKQGIGDFMDMYQPANKFERAVDKASNSFFLANLLTPWTDFAKVGAGMVSMNALSNAAEAVVKGTAKPGQLRRLAESGIDRDMAARIWKQLEAEGGSNVVNGVRVSNTGNWKDSAARDAFEGALSRESDIAVITPGQERSLLMSRSPALALILQYKTFVQAATERLLYRGMQARDVQALSGFLSAITLGMVSQAAYSATTGSELPKTPSDWVKQGISRSGFTGWLEEMNSISSKWTDGTWDAYRLLGATQPASRYQSRDKLGVLLGPTANKLSGLIQAGGHAAQLDWKDSDTRALRRVVAGQNLFYVRWLLKQAGAED